jgi:TatD DNase family protein
LIPDSHAHLDLIEENEGIVVEQALKAGVAPIITIGIDVPSSIAAISSAHRHDCVYATVGIHPNDCAGALGEDFDRLEELALDGRVVAIGETGLDYYRDRSPAEAQKAAFRAQAGIAKRLGKALVVHDREAHADALELLASQVSGEVPVVMHCFSGGRDELDECVRRGYYFSFAGPVTFKNSQRTREMAALVPAGRLLCETDSPFLSPEPFRGRANFPERVRLVAEALAAARGLALEELEALLADNTARAFGVHVEVS